ncbi:methionine adenosyltransferase [Candidatus Woesearchaeota archaeon]|nr:methionine adenosyltransferase [Candidatus Woesearchaeota archaeon]
MTKRRYVFTSESVSPAHPDKMCDNISDAILDAVIKDDPYARVAIESFAKTGFVVVGGELTTKTYVDVPAIVRKTIVDVGYDNPAYCFDGNTCGVLIAISEQSPDISQGVDETKEHEQGAGDQGLMFGYATNETPELMPTPIILAHKLIQRYVEVRKSKTIPYLRPDAKSQVSVEYEDGKPVRVHTVVMACQHDEDASLEKLREEVKEKIILPICGKLVDSNTRYFINGTGKFVLGGPVADAGLTGRKIIVDTYGGHGSHGGGCFSGKDPSKVDRSAAYMARYVAKNIVAAGLADKCEVQIAYCIGIAEPVSVLVNCFHTNKIPEEDIEKLVRKHFPLKPAQIIKHLNLRRPIYRKTAAFGHFGRNDPDFTWEKTDLAETLKKEGATFKSTASENGKSGKDVPLD